MNTIAGWMKDIRKFLQNLNTYIHQRPYLKLFLVFVFFFLVFTWMYMSVSPLSSGDDHFFQFRFAQLMSQKGFWQSFWNFKAIYFSKMAENKYFVYNDFLYYLAIRSFTYIEPLFLGIKLYAIFAVALGMSILYEVMRRLNVRYPFIWTVAIFGLPGYMTFWRFFLSRAYTLAPAWLMLLLYCLHKKKYFWVFLISGAYFYWHSSTFFFPLIIAVSYYIIELFYGQKGSWKNLLAAGLGVGASLFLSLFLIPNFFLFIKDTDIGIFWENVLGKKIFIPLGGEIYPIPFFDYLNANVLIFSLYVLAVCVEIAHYLGFRKTFERGNEETKETALLRLRTTVFFISLGFFMGVVIFSSRFNDYFIYFAGFYLALALDNLFRDIHFRLTATKTAVVCGLLIVTGYLFVNNVIAIQTYIADQGTPVEVFQGVGTWLSTHTAPGDIVFNASWDWFPQLYYYSPSNNYVTGINPRFLYVYNTKLYWEWIHMTYQGYVCGIETCPDLDTMATEALIKSPDSAFAKNWYLSQGNAIAETITKDFKSHYIVSSGQYPFFNKILDNNSHFTQVYGKDKANFIYEVK